MKEKAKTKKYLLKELNSLQRKYNNLKKASQKLSSSRVEEVNIHIDELLYQTEAKYHNIFEESFDGLFITSPDGRILDINKRGMMILGYDTKEEIYNLDLATDVYTNPLDRQEILSVVNSQGSAEYEVEVKKKNGERIITKCSLVASTDSSGVIRTYRGIIRDISKQKQSEKALRESEEKYHSVFENSINAIFLTNPDGRIIAANPEACRMFGRTEEELCLLGRESVVDVKDSRLAPALEERASKGSFNGELTFIRKDGTKFPGLLASSIFLDKEGNKQTIVVIHDITIRKLAEEKLEKYSHELKRLNAGKDKLFSIIAHDLRSPFNSLLGFSEIMVNDFESLTPEEIKDYNKRIYSALKNEYTLLENILNWSRLETGQMEFKPEKINLYNKTERVINLLLENARLKGITLSNRTDKNIFVSADPNMLYSVLQNLISNSIKFTSKDGLIKISSKKVNKNFIQTTVSDTGIGITNDGIKKLFSLATTSTAGTDSEKGTGLGLIICREIIERHGGTISAKSEFGKGTDISFNLPMA